MPSNVSAASASITSDRTAVITTAAADSPATAAAAIRLPFSFFLFFIILFISSLPITIEMNYPLHEYWYCPGAGGYQDYIFLIYSKIIVTNVLILGSSFADTLTVRLLNSI